jgi:hypothetical protein
VYLVSPQPRVKGRHPSPENIFISAKQALELSHEPFLQLTVRIVHGLRVLAYARAALGTRSSGALRSSPGPATDGKPTRFSRTGSVSTVPQTAVSCNYGGAIS